MAHVMIYGTFEDVSKVKKSLGISAFKDALDHMPPGIIDEKSWYYWNTIMDRHPVPPLPKKTFC